jgi:hypothetical protein
VATVSDITSSAVGVANCPARAALLSSLIVNA